MQRKKKKKNFSPCLMPYMKINSKWNTDLNIKLKTIKILEENLYDLGLGKEFLDTSSDLTSLREQKQIELDQNRKLCFVKDTR